MNINLFKKSLRYVYLHGWLYRRIDKTHRRRINNIKSRGTEVRVVFMAMSVSMWRYQHLYELMRLDQHFSATIVLSPSIDYAPEQQDLDIERLRSYFDARGTTYIDWNPAAPCDIGRELDPDIILYPQPYEHLLVPQHDCTSHYDRLLCYYPYAFWTSTGKWSYNFHFHNLAWRLFYSTTLHLAEAQKEAWNHGRNVRVVGYPNADDYLCDQHSDVWKPLPDGLRRKRLIWAPHYSIVAEFGLVPRSNFLAMAEGMLALAHEHRDHLQVAFKPHPRLLTKLYHHPDWGKERTDAYYQSWADGANTQLETGDFIDLFMTSDAMVHDSGSFAVEYHYSQRPVMFVAQDMAPLLETQSEFGKLAYSLHYQGKGMDDVKRFVEQVVLGGDDPLMAQRKDFFTQHLVPPHGQTVAQNTMDELRLALTDVAQD